MKKVKVFALLSAVVTALLIFFFLNSLSSMNDDEKMKVMTAAMDIPPNVTITEDMITAAELPLTAVISGVMTEPDQVIGKVAKSDILAGEQILGGKLISVADNTNGTLAYALEPGMRAITIAVDVTTGLSGMLKPQDRIDLIGEFEYQSAGKPLDSYSNLLAENIKILAVDNVLSAQGKANGEGSAYVTITLEVTPKQAMEISLAVYKGQLRAVLRSPLDEETTGLPNITLDNIMAN
ncbi:Flp pilus assembly protein CpaB [Sinanaerobacter chloroacetimidivorans]|uniref:Flp pilus assembly protein CpaB n=1 Tax=Sinanaerobacter chloroacetimidivorans TaxID=2818044 RepID=A0A8J8B554_9FIRM|nr:Flp pilus assembly protein CpaB [Sinanaerobacter chloroacetimidivorans]MBR0600010.1 Flp pilus assembly protein CpaB [Sinanaerobacter chloroacetimidivorans]